MKKILSLIIIALCCLWSCAPENPSMDFTPIADDPRIKIYDIAEDNSFMLVNGLRGQILPPKWDLGNGQTAVGDTVYGRYAFAGEYTVTMTGFDGQKEISVKKIIRITQDNMALVSDPVYDFLTGGVSAVNGKTWVLDSLRTGHIRLKKSDSDDRKVPLFYAGTGMYDDEITFKLLGAECIYENHGQSYSHGGTIDGIGQYRIEQLRQMGTVSGVKSSPKGDFIVDYTPGIKPQKWALIKRTETVNNISKDVYYLKLTGGAYMFFYRGNSPADIEYKIDSIGENYMRVIHYETFPASRGAAGWQDHYILVPKGYPIQPEVPTEPEKPVEDNIKEDFEKSEKSLTFTYYGIGNNSWGLPAYSIVRNISMTGINADDSIARFVRGTGVDEQLRLVRNKTIDISEKNKLTMDVYLPSTNNYLNVNLKPTVEVRLMNSKNTSQVAIKTMTVAAADFNKWIRLTFDFSSYASTTTYDTWIFQFGGQYTIPDKASPGVFYFDNLSLTK